MDTSKRRFVWTLLAAVLVAIGWYFVTNNQQRSVAVRAPEAQPYSTGTPNRALQKHKKDDTPVVPAKTNNDVIEQQISDIRHRIRGLWSAIDPLSDWELLLYGSPDDGARYLLEHFDELSNDDKYITSLRLKLCVALNDYYWFTKEELATYKGSFFAKMTERELAFCRGVDRAHYAARVEEIFSKAGEFGQKARSLSAQIYYQAVSTHNDIERFYQIAAQAKRPEDFLAIANNYMRYRNSLKVGIDDKMLAAFFVAAAEHDGIDMADVWSVPDTCWTFNKVFKSVLCRAHSNFYPDIVTHLVPDPRERLEVYRTAEQMVEQVVYGQGLTLPHLFVVPDEASSSSDHDARQTSGIRGVNN